MIGFFAGSVIGIMMHRGVGLLYTRVYHGDHLMLWSNKNLRLLTLLALGLIGGVVLYRQANGSTPAESAALTPDNPGPLLAADGVLAGQVLVEATNRPIRASIMIEKLDSEEATAEDLDVTTDDSGYFTIPKLSVGKTYLIIARANDNGDLISREMYVRPPNLRLSIRLDKRYTKANTTPPKP